MTGQERESAAPRGGIEVAAVIVRRVEPGELTRWIQLIDEHHYLGFQRCLVGERVCHVAEYDGEWVALVGWAAAAWHCHARDRWIGWTVQQQRKRLKFVANNVRFLILPGWHYPNVGSRVLSQSVRRLSTDWEEQWGHRVVLAETFVEARLFTGGVYRAAGWEEIGETLGYGRTHTSKNSYVYHGNSKKVFVMPLGVPARQWLCAVWDVRALQMRRRYGMDFNSTAVRGKEGSLYELCATLPDCRKARGIRHVYVSILAIALAGIATGVRSYRELGEWAIQLTQEQRERLGVQKKFGKYKSPSESTLRRTLQKSDVVLLDRVLGQWLISVQGGELKAIACDGKHVRGAAHGGTQLNLVSAFTHGTKTVIAQTAVDSKTNEIPAMKILLEDLDLTGTVVTADALHTQKDFARFVVEAKHADYVLTAKGNQPGIEAAIRELDDSSFSPSRHSG